MVKLKSAYGRIVRKLLHVKDRNVTSMALHIDPLNVIVRKNAGSLYRRILIGNNKLVYTFMTVLCLDISKRFYVKCDI